MDLKKALSAIYTLIGASFKDHFIFTSSGAEAITHVILSTYFDITRTTGKNHFLTTKYEIAPILLGLSRLEQLGCVVQKAPQTTLKAIAQEINPRTALLSLSAACPLTGIVNPELEAIASLCKERGILFHVDVTELLGKMEIPTTCDLITFDGPVDGTGGLLMKEGMELGPLIIGGNEQGGLRGGKISEKLLIEAGKQAERLWNERDFYSTEVAFLRSHFEEELKKKAGAKLLFEDSTRLPHISLVEFPDVHYESMHLLLERKGIPSEIGGGRLQRLPYLLADMKSPSFSALSFSLKGEREKMERMIETIVSCAEHLRSYWK